VTREEKLLWRLDRSGRGLEIGPSYNPVASKRNGFDVKIVDIASRDELRAKYASHNVSLENIEEVDYIWQGQPYCELVGEWNCFDWIVASHVIEHTPDLIAFLNDCGDILKPDGILSLAIPDKRRCFDYFRPISGLEKVIDAHCLGQKTHSAGTIAEYLLNATRGAGSITWEGRIEGPFEIICPLSEAIAHYESSLKTPTTIDAHAWCFTPSSFRMLINDLNRLNAISLNEVRWLPTSGPEFFIQLSRAGAGAEE